jgi:acetyl-CoA acetyltransferase
MTDVAVAHGRTSIARATRGALKPYGMSRTRHLGQTWLELARRGGRRAVGVCTAGGMATATYLEWP